MAVRNRFTFKTVLPNKLKLNNEMKTIIKAKKKIGDKRIVIRFNKLEKGKVRVLPQLENKIGKIEMRKINEEGKIKRKQAYKRQIEEETDKPETIEEEQYKIKKEKNKQTKLKTDKRIKETDKTDKIKEATEEKANKKTDKRIETDKIKTITEANKRKIECECGRNYTKSNKSRHYKRWHNTLQSAKSKYNPNKIVECGCGRTYTKTNKSRHYKRYHEN